MGAPMVIKWTDGGAPTLSRVEGALIGVLDYCLPQKGWVKEFSGTGKAVYRAASGERKFYRVLNDGSFYYSSTSYQYCHAKITAYDAMTDVDTGTGQWGESYLPVSNSGTAVVRPWVCIFNETTVLLVVLPHLTTGLTLATSNSWLGGFGETLAALPGNTNRNFIAGGILASPTASGSTLTFPLSAGSLSSYTSYAAPIRVNRSLDGTRLAINCGIIGNGGQHGAIQDNIYPFGRSDTVVLSYPYNGSLLYARPLIDDGVAYSMGDLVPGLCYALHKGNTLDNWADYASDDLDFIAVRVACPHGGLTTTSAGYIGAMLICKDAGYWT